MIGQKPPASAREIGKVTSELKRMLNELPSSQSLSKSTNEGVTP